MKGEITLLIGKSPKGEAQQVDQTSIEEAVAMCMREGLTRMDAVKAVAKRRGLSKREVYAQTLAGRD